MFELFSLRFGRTTVAPTPPASLLAPEDIRSVDEAELRSRADMGDAPAANELRRRTLVLLAVEESLGWQAREQEATDRLRTERFERRTARLRGETVIRVHVRRDGDVEERVDTRSRGRGREEAPRRQPTAGRTRTPEQEDPDFKTGFEEGSSGKPYAPGTRNDHAHRAYTAGWHEGKEQSGSKASASAPNPGADAGA